MFNLLCRATFVGSLAILLCGSSVFADLEQDLELFQTRLSGGKPANAKPNAKPKSASRAPAAVAPRADVKRKAAAAPQKRQPAQAQPIVTLRTVPKKNVFNRRAPASSVEDSLPETGGVISYETWMIQGISGYDRTPASIQTKRAIKSAELSEQKSIRQSPFTVSTTVSQQTIPGKTTAEGYTGFSLEKIEGTVVSPALTYQDWGGFSSRLTVNLGFDRYMPNQTRPPIDLTTGQGTTSLDIDNPFNLTLKVSQEIIKEGGSGSDKTQSKIAALSARSTKFGQEANNMDNKFTFFNLLTDIYVTECKLADLKKAQQYVAESVQLGKVQLNTRIISYQEYLQILELDSDFASRRAVLESQRASFIQDALVWGGEIQRAAAKLQELSPSCAYDETTVSEKSQRLILQDDEIEALARSLPTYTVKDLIQESGELSVRVAELTNKPSLNVFLESTYARAQVTQIEKWGGYTVGVEMSWNIPGDKGKFSESAARADVAANISDTRKTYFGNVSMLKQLQIQIDSNQKVMEASRKSFSSSRVLLEILATQRSIGSVDALAYTNAYLKYIGASQSYAESWGSVEKSLYKLSQLRTYFKPEVVIVPKRKVEPKYDLDL